MKEEKPGALPYLLLLCHAIIVGLSYIFVKLSMQYASTFDVLAQRFTFAFLSVLFYNHLTKAEIRFSKQDLLRFLPLGLLYPLLFFILQIFGLQYASAMQTGLLTSVAPVITLFFAHFLIHEPIVLKQVLGVLVAVLGVILLQWMNLRQSETGEFIGFILVFSSVFVMSLNIVLTRSYTKSYSLQKITTFILALSFLVFNGIALTQHMIDGEWLSFFRPLTNLNYLFVLSFLGILSSFGTALISAYALSRMASVPVAVFSSFSPLVTIISSVMILGESFYWYHFLGAVLITSGALITNLSKKSPNK